MKKITQAEIIELGYKLQAMKIAHCQDCDKDFFDKDEVEAIKYHGGVCETCYKLRADQYEPLEDEGGHPNSEAIAEKAEQLRDEMKEDGMTAEEAKDWDNEILEAEATGN